ncbi:DUF262 domain-containing protein [Thiocystis violacea]|uniref:DUF262 domain-containing protein n=1 Tax=Thiocystis violacea TaxID=13725 RepID=UPI001906BE4A|nr:DUF262 domain-containing protein [Thiocystis violacea]MBK1725091.1 hypothetical protein [Thiocystis violacea]
MTSTDSHLIKNERIDVVTGEAQAAASPPDSVINEKYIKGEVRIVTEQARYPLNTIASMVEDKGYKLSPEYQRRHRWSVEKQSRLIESLIMNVPVPPIFLYEYEYSKYEVMDGLQRLTALHDFYRDKIRLEGLDQWPELNGKTYSELPEKVREGIDRRYLSSVILLKETAKSSEEALRLKQMVFERINSGGVKLEPQEARNAILDGPMNQKCMELSRNEVLCRLWGIPQPDEQEINGGPPSQERIENEDYRTMADVELVLRFFAYRQKHRLHKSGESLGTYFNNYLRHANSFPNETINTLGDIFEKTIQLAEDIFGEKAFWLFRKRERGSEEHWRWLERPAISVYEPLMRVLSEKLENAQELKERKNIILGGMEDFYRNRYGAFEGRNVNPSALTAREDAYRELLSSVLD